MKTGKLNTEKLRNIQDKNLAKKYRELEAFLNSIFKITNASIPSIAEANPILCKLVYPKLKELKDSVLADIQAFENVNIDVYSIVSSNRSAISNLVLYFFPNLIWKLEKDCKQLKQIELLEQTFSTVERIKYLEKLNTDLEQKELLYNNMSAIGSKLADSYLSDIQDIKKEIEAIEKTLNTITLEQIEIDLRNCIVARLNNYVERLDSKIRFLERHSEVLEHE